jgi:hypothetical protein
MQKSHAIMTAVAVGGAANRGVREHSNKCRRKSNSPAKY